MNPQDIFLGKFIKSEERSGGAGSGGRSGGRSWGAATWGRLWGAATWERSGGTDIGDTGLFQKEVTMSVFEEIDSNILEVVFNQLNKYLNSNGYLDDFQSGFRTHHNTER